MAGQQVWRRCFSVLPSQCPRQDPGVTLIGIGFIPGDALDRSGLARISICQRDDATVCIDQATLGGLGSGVTYTGFDNVFLAVPDRGPFDGRTDVPYLDRFHFLHITVDPNAAFPNIKTVLLDTRFLKDERNRQLRRRCLRVRHRAIRARHAASIRRASPSASSAISSSPTNTGPTSASSIASGTCCGGFRVPEKFLLDPDERASERRRRQRRQLARALSGIQRDRPAGESRHGRPRRSRRTAARSSASCRTRCCRITASTRPPSVASASTTAS